MNTLRVPIYITLHPDYPERAFVTTTAWTPERAEALQAQGAELHKIEAVLPTRLTWEPPARIVHELPYEGRTVRLSSGRKRGFVSLESLHDVTVAWDDGSVGTYSRQAFEKSLSEGRLQLQDDAP